MNPTATENQIGRAGRCEKRVRIEELEVRIQKKLSGSALPPTLPPQLADACLHTCDSFDLKIYCSLNTLVLHSRLWKIVSSPLWYSRLGSLLFPSVFAPVIFASLLCSSIISFAPLVQRVTATLHCVPCPTTHTSFRPPQFQCSINKTPLTMLSVCVLFLGLGS